MRERKDVLVRAEMYYFPFERVRYKRGVEGNGVGMRGLEKAGNRLRRTQFAALTK